MNIRKYILLITFILLSVSGIKAKESSNKPFTIVLDAGHGGKDAGACDNNVREKDINLGVVQQLGKLIEQKMPDAKVVYTRNSDTYLTLQERADKANAAKGDLFISVHTNSVDKSNPRRSSVAGASVYALGLHKDQNNMNVAMRENSVIELEKNFEEKYSGFDPQRDESYIIFEMAQKKTLSKSIKFANEAQKQLVKTAGRADRGVHQAGFWVLWATSMPAVLVELDFICNPNSAKYMASEQGQQKLAEALFSAIESYHKVGRQTSAAEAPEEMPAATQLAAAAPDGDTEGVTLAACAEPTAREDRPEPVQTNGNGQRRRRSTASRQASDQRVVETETILIAVEQPPILVEEVAEEQVVAEQPATTTPSSRKADRKSRRAKAQEKAEQTAQAKASDKQQAKAETQRNGASRHQARTDRFRTVYKIQILASPKLLKNNDPEFCGLSPVKSFKENNLYKYTFGETEERAEIDALLSSVREKIPGAFVIKTLMPVTGN